MTARIALPNRRPSLTTETAWHDHPVRVTVGYDLHGSPREVFANTERGGDMQASLADCCVIISIALQHGVTPDALAKSLGRVPTWVNGEPAMGAASPVGVILDVGKGTP